jgi:hypothetical protein
MKVHFKGTAEPQLAWDLVCNGKWLQPASGALVCCTGRPHCAVAELAIVKLLLLVMVRNPNM